LAGGVYRKRALQTLLAVGVISLPAALWVWRVSPHWIQELHANVVSLTAHGALNDPGPASTGAHGIAMVISLQAAFSFFRDDPHFYNLATYLVCGPLIVWWMVVTLRTRPSAAKAWMALASMAALSMLPVYHRQYDAKLLLLTIPAFAMLWTTGGKIKWIALAVNAAAFVMTGDIPWAILLGVLHSLHLPETGTPNQIATALQVLPVPLTLLAMGIFYLWVYARLCSQAHLISKSEPAFPFAEQRQFPKDELIGSLPRRSSRSAKTPEHLPVESACCEWCPPGVPGWNARRGRRRDARQARRS
jgi:hypothetical protein